MSIPRVVVLGGGFAALETAFLLRMSLGPAVDVTVVSDQSSFLFKPNTIYIPFGADEDSMIVELSGPLHGQQINFQRGRVMGLDPDARRIELSDRTTIAYDFAVVGTGAAMRPDEVPGLTEHASMIWTPAQMRHLAARPQELRTRAMRGEQLDVLFLVPPGNKCAGPLYEIAFMLESWLRRHSARDRVTITWSTVEPTFIHAFGPRLHDVVAGEFAVRGIDGHTNEVVVDGGGRCALRRWHGPPVRRARVVPTVCRRAQLRRSADRRPRLPHLRPRNPAGHRLARDLCAGDAGDFAVKQAFLAFLQADAAADHLASRIGGRPFERPFDPVSMCVMDMFDKAAFAQVPLRLTGDATDPVAVRPEADGAYRVGVSPLWRLGKKTLGLYVSRRFRRGQPFHAGTAWHVMEAALKGMASILAD